MTDRVKASLGYTANLGDFNSLRVDVGVETDVRTGEKAGEALDRAFSLVERELERRVKKGIDDLS